MLLYLAWKRILIYRSVSLVYVSLSLLNIFLTIAIWTVVYKNPVHTPSVSFSVFISYFAVMIIFTQFVNSYASGEMADIHIKRGQLSVYLLKPFPYLVQEWILEIPWRIMAFFMSLPALLIIIFLFQDSINLNPVFIIIALTLVVGAFVLSYLIQICFAMLTFWLEDSHGVLSVLEILTLLFTGMGMPIFFFPPLLKTLAYILPFQYILYFPVALAVNLLNDREIIFFVCMYFGWIVILTFVASQLWKNGLKKFTGEGT